MQRGTALRILAALAALHLLAGCNPMSSLKTLTGQKDNTILPGQREEILPPDQQVLRDQGVKRQAAPGQAAAPCDPAISDCQPAPQGGDIYGGQ